MEEVKFLSGVEWPLADGDVRDPRADGDVRAPGADGHVRAPGGVRASVGAE